MAKGEVDFPDNRAFVVALVKAWRGGPGRFYTYTFGAGLLAFIGAPWWAPVIEAIGTWLLIEVAARLNVNLPEKEPSVSPWFVAAGGFIICIVSMLMFYLIHLKTKQAEPVPTDGHLNLSIPSGSNLRSAIYCVAGVTGMVVTKLDIPDHLLDCSVQSGTFGWRSREDAIKSLGHLLKGNKHVCIEITEALGGYRISGKELE